MPEKLKPKRTINNKTARTRLLLASKVRTLHLIKFFLQLKQIASNFSYLRDPGLMNIAGCRDLLAAGYLSPPFAGGDNSAAVLGIILA
jgi:hypothetical protein